MQTKTPTMLVILVETVRLRWFVAAVGLDGVATPLLCSEADDLGPYRGLDFDEQVAFLRHRFCGVLQRGSLDAIIHDDAIPVPPLQEIVE